MNPTVVCPQCGHWTSDHASHRTYHAQKNPNRWYADEEEEMGEYPAPPFESPGPSPEEVADAVKDLEKVLEELS